MEEYVCLYITANLTAATDVAMALMERNLAVRADILKVMPIYLKNNNARIGFQNHDTVMLQVERAKLDEVMNTLQAEYLKDQSLYAYAVPTLATVGNLG